MRVLAEIPARSSSELRAGTLRRADLAVYGDLRRELGVARVVLMTGTGTGRREVAAGLAAAAAAAGTRTALLECDLVEPGLAEALGLAVAPGLHEHLRGAAEVGGILKPLILAGPGSAQATEPLVCIVAGRPSADGPRLLASPAMTAAVDGLRAAYELVVIAGPPLRDELSLATLLGLADATVACLEPSEPRDLPITVTGLVIQG